jgi:hypothetical protein
MGTSFFSLSVYYAKIGETFGMEKNHVYIFAFVIFHVLCNYSI